jgi:hypothetical protein
MSSDLSGEITAIATAVLAAFAIITAALAYMAFRRQTQEVTILQQQMKEQQDVLAREARERHRAQAARVFISLSYNDAEQYTFFMVANTSEQPIYETEIHWTTHHGVKRTTTYRSLGTILPGDRPSADTIEDQCPNPLSLLSLTSPARRNRPSPASRRTSKSRPLGREACRPRPSTSRPTRRTGGSPRRPCRFDRPDLPECRARGELLYD